MTQAVLNSEFNAIVAGNVTVYNYTSESREYFSTSVEFLPVGVGLPAHSCADAPGESKAGYAICRTADLSAWEYVVDHRGETVYSTETGIAQLITTLGDYPPGTTPSAPTTPFDKWEGKGWVTDNQALKADHIRWAEREKRHLLNVAKEKIDIYQDAIDLGMATEEEKAALTIWRKYRVLLNRVDCTTAPNIDWPEPPK
ncbi:tail fiber assembly protein [Xenorhabdus sp. Flor]|uniref:tail fiber assembly protein n=1 Tax=Xenorhabdus cabanillasii TaxID=351673 RepID=UPI0019C2B2F8|nr:tail fiber assembly protein [Xenorhabdus sp. Flor]MBD2816481.1 tail fiber assembly protein [Xenorhabdus sp. Flor]